MIHHGPSDQTARAVFALCLFPVSFLNNIVHMDTDLERVINTGIYIYSHILVPVVNSYSFLFRAAGAAANADGTGGCSQK